MSSVVHSTRQYENNRAEVSHQPEGEQVKITVWCASVADISAKGGAEGSGWAELFERSYCARPLAGRNSKEKLCAGRRSTRSFSRSAAVIAVLAGYSFAVAHFEYVSVVEDATGVPVRRLN